MLSFPVAFFFGCTTHTAKNYHMARRAAAPTIASYSYYKSTYDAFTSLAIAFWQNNSRSFL
jgi:hypothetical protein